MSRVGFNTPTDKDMQYFEAKDVFKAGKLNHHIANTAYPIAHTLTMMDYRLPNSSKHDFAKKVWDGVDELGLYVHIPFCEHRCRFCEYTVIDPATNQSNEDAYFQRLIKEFHLYKEHTDVSGKKLIGFDIGGGTPSLPDPKYIEMVLKAAQSTFYIPNDMDISIETTPKIAFSDPKKIKSYKEMGINRISMGVQSISASVLENAGRTNTSISWNKGAVENIRDAGFDKFNVDIMYGLIGQTIDNLKATLAHVLSLEPEFVTVYRTRYKGTKMAEQGMTVTLDDINAQQFAIKDILLEAGYEGELGKNTYSKIKGNAGTSDYLTKRVINGTEYLGLGLGSQSFSVRGLSYNSGAASKKMDSYYKDIDEGVLPIQDIYHLPKCASMGKFISVSFYFGGISLSSFKTNYGMELSEAFPAEVSFVLENGYMRYDGDYIRLTEKGVIDFNGVISLFYSSSIKEYLLNR